MTVAAERAERDMLAAAERLRGSGLVVEKSHDDPPTPSRFRLYTAAELAEIAEPEPLVAGVLNRNTLAMMVATYASFKSFVALDLALHIAHGLDWHGHEVARGDVLYIYAEGARSIRRRVEAWRQFNGLPDIGGIHFLPQSVLVNDPRDLNDLVRAIEDQGLTLALGILDTVARTFKGNENATEDMGAYIVACDRLKERTGATILLVHHTGWEGKRSRGSNSLPGALDTELTLTREGDRVTVAATKQKDGVEGDIVTLEAVPIAGSLAFRRFGPMTPTLSANERTALVTVQEADGLTSKTWETDSGLAHSSFMNARKRLVALAYVRLDKKVYTATDAGRLAISPTVQASTNAVQTVTSPVSPSLPGIYTGRLGLDGDGQGEDAA